MSSVVKQNQPRYTVTDYLCWPDDERWELIAGAAYNMSPAPTIKHQSIAGDIFGPGDSLTLQSLPDLVIPLWEITASKRLRIPPQQRQ